MNQNNRHEPVFVVECFECHFTDEIPVSEITYYLRCHCGSVNIQWYPLDYGIAHAEDDYFAGESFDIEE
jgi:hypothetical protein